MPQMNGYELVKRIKLCNESQGLLMSAFEINDLEFSKVEFPSVKIDGFISKPISLKDLTTRIKNYLKY